MSENKFIQAGTSIINDDVLYETVDCSLKLLSYVGT